MHLYWSLVCGLVMFESFGITSSFNCVLWTEAMADVHISLDANILVLTASKKQSTYFYFFTSEEVSMCLSDFFHTSCQIVCPFCHATFSPAPGMLLLKVIIHSLDFILFNLNTLSWYNHRWKSFYELFISHHDNQKNHKTSKKYKQKNIKKDICHFYYCYIICICTKQSANFIINLYNS